MDTLLIVEDEKMIRLGIKVMAYRSGVPIARILDCSDGAQALEILRSEAVDGMITDIHMPRMDGIALARAMQALPRVPVTIVLSGYDSFPYAVEMMRCGIKDYILKPVERGRLTAALRKMDAEVSKARVEQHYPDSRSANTTAASPSAEKMRKAIIFMQENYYRGINMTEVSNYVSMNYTQFSDTFKEITKQNFVTYLQNIRLEQAKRLLRTTDLRVCDIGCKVGYQDEKHFLKVFRAVTGVSPSAFRKGQTVSDNKEDSQ